MGGCTCAGSPRCWAGDHGVQLRQACSMPHSLAGHMLLLTNRVRLAKRGKGFAAVGSGVAAVPAQAAGISWSWSLVISMRERHC